MRAALLLLLAGAVAGAGVTLLVLPKPLLAQTPPAPARSGGNELLRADLPDVPGKQLVVVPLRFLPITGARPPAHQHPGSVFVYVTKGEARLGIAGQEPRVVPTGQGFFEPVGSIHNVSESASPTDTATGIAVMIVPDGAPLVSPVAAGHAGH